MGSISSHCRKVMIEMEKQHQGKAILVAGGAGFIGSSFIHMMLKKHPEGRIINYDLLTYAGNLENLSDIKHHPNYFFIRGDIRDSEAVRRVFSLYNIDAVFNFAAESHVDRSIVEPEAFLTTNVNGKQVLLNAAKDHWKLEPGNKHSRMYKPGVRFVQVSTDEVYGALGKEGKFVESALLLANNPYSATKASADLIVRVYHEIFGLLINITRCSNNYTLTSIPKSSSR